MTYEELKAKRDALALEMATAEAELKLEGEKSLVVAVEKMLDEIKLIGYQDFSYEETTEDGYIIRIAKKGKKAVKKAEGDATGRISTKGKAHVSKDGNTEVFDSAKAACDKYGLAYGSGSAAALLRKKGYTVDYIAA